MLFPLKPAALRRSVRIVFAIVCLAGGLQLFLYLRHVSGLAGPAVARPPVVEGFLPIAALLGLKRLSLGEGYDFVHPAGLTILLAVLAASWLLRRSFCGHVCPVGFMSEALGRLGQRLGLGRRGARILDTPLRGVKFVILGFFLVQVGGMDAASLESFVTSPYNITADARMLLFYRNPSGTALVVLAVLAALGLVFRNAWCRWLCPYGALLGLAALAGPTAVRRDPSACVGCGTCERNCPAAIPIRSKTAMRGPECLGCGQCVANCPVPGALNVRFLGRPVSWKTLCLGAAVVMFGAWLLALSLGHWHSALPASMLDALYARAFLAS